ncbi:hypothetical protein ACHAQC_006375 [Fusarium culmorum]
MDECHERSIDAGILLAPMKETLYQRPNMRLVIMSATVHTIYTSVLVGDCMLPIPTADTGTGKTVPKEDAFLFKDMINLSFKCMCICMVRNIADNAGKYISLQTCSIKSSARNRVTLQLMALL